MKKALLFLFTFLSCFLFSAETTILLIRHGETDWNREDRLQGHTDIPLNETGLKQARRLAQKLKEKHPDIAAIYSSDLTRAHQTAAETAKELEIETITTNPLLRERFYGEAEGLTVRESLKKYAERADAINQNYATRKEKWDHSAIPDGEPYNRLIQRVREQLSAIAAKSPGKKVAVFAHGCVLSTLIADCLDLEDRPKIPNCAVGVFNYTPESELKFVQIDP